MLDHTILASSTKQPYLCHCEKCRIFFTKANKIWSMLLIGNKLTEEVWWILKEVSLSLKTKGRTGFWKLKANSGGVGFETVGCFYLGETHAHCYRKTETCSCRRMCKSIVIRFKYWIQHNSCLMILRFVVCFSHTYA